MLGAVAFYKINILKLVKHLYLLFLVYLKKLN